jgi:hypothetical protein
VRAFARKAHGLQMLEPNVPQCRRCGVDRTSANGPVRLACAINTTGRRASNGTLDVVDEVDDAPVTIERWQESVAG